MDRRLAEAAAVMVLTRRQLEHALGRPVSDEEWSDYAAASSLGFAGPPVDEVAPSGPDLMER